MSRALTDLPWPRRTERLLLRPPVLDDVRAVHAYRSDPQTAQWLTAVATSVEERARGARAELGWVIAPPHRGHGYAVEAVRELVTIAVELGVHRVEASCFADNVASRRVMEKVGLRPEGHYVRDSLHRDGTWRDAMSWAILADEWDAAAREPRRGG